MINDDIISSVTAGLKETKKYFFVDNLIWLRDNKIKYIRYGDRPDKKKESGILPSVTHLKFRNNFNEPLGGSIPSSVTHLIFGNIFDAEGKQ